MKELLEAFIRELKSDEQLWRDAYPNGGTGKAVHTNFANWLAKYGRQLQDIADQMPPTREASAKERA